MRHLSPPVAPRKRAGALLALGCAAAFAGNAAAATLSVGPGKTYAAPCAAIGAAKSGDVIEIAGNNTYSGDVCAIYGSNLTIRGVNGRPKIDAAGKSSQGKAIWVVVGNNLTVENVEMLGAKVPDMNGAAFRLEGAGFTLRSSYLHDNENGILAGVNTNSDVLVEYSEFSHNGAGDGRSHNLYIGNVRSLTFRYNYTHDANVGHNLKSRAITNTILYNRISSTGLGQPSYELDFPNAGTTYVIGNVIQQPAANQNPAMLAYGEEGASNPGQDLYVINNTFLNDRGSGGTFLAISSNVTTPALVQNNIFAGVGTAITQANAIDKTNFRGAAPAFVDRAGFDLHPLANPLIVGAGSAPGTSASGFALAPTAQYKHLAASEPRPVSAKVDIGAYAATASAPAGGTAAVVPSPSAGWTICAADGAACAFTGTRQVRYGAGSAYAIRTLAGPVACSAAVFGDPAPGVAKSCSVANAFLAAPALAEPGWTYCGGEGGTCMFSGVRQVRYGADGKYATKTLTGPVACNNVVFGDPATGVVKACSYASAPK